MRRVRFVEQRIRGDVAAPTLGDLGSFFGFSLGSRARDKANRSASLSVGSSHKNVYRGSFFSKE